MSGYGKELSGKREKFDLVSTANGSMHHPGGMAGQFEKEPGTPDFAHFESQVVDY